MRSKCTQLYYYSVGLPIKLIYCAHFAQIAQYNVFYNTQNFAKGIFYDYLSHKITFDWMSFMENFMQLFGELPSIVQKFDNYCE